MFTIQQKLNSQCLISDSEWEMILTSGAYHKFGEFYFAVYKKYVLRFNFSNSGDVILLAANKKPSRKYELPLLSKGMNIKDRIEIYKERHRLITNKTFLTY